MQKPTQAHQPGTSQETPKFIRLPHSEPSTGHHGPRKDLVTDLRDYEEERRSIHLCLDRFTNEHDPLALMQAFVLSMHVGVYPPVAMLQTLASAFQMVLTGQGDTQFDVVLGLNGKTRSPESAMPKPRKRGTQFWLATTIYALINGYEMSLAEAAERVSLFLETHPSLERYSADGLIDRYARTWKKEFHLDTLAPTDLLHPASWTPVWRAAFLQQFPGPV